MIFHHRSSISVIQNQPFTIISKYVINTTPLWVYIISTIVGVLSLILISYALYRVCSKEVIFCLGKLIIILNFLQFGFFKRGKREELVQLKRQSQAQSYYPPEDDQF